MMQITKVMGCLICNGPHRAKDSSKKEKLNTLVVEQENDDNESKVTPQMSLLQLLNAI